MNYALSMTVDAAGLDLTKYFVLVSDGFTAAGLPAGVPPVPAGRPERRRRLRG